jgi:dienelactone hydrolase
MSKPFPVTLISLLAALMAGVLLPRQGSSARPATSGPAEEIVLREGLVVRSVGRSGRSPVHTDAIEAQIVAGRWQAPKAGDVIALPDGSVRSWEVLKAGEDGSFRHPALAGGYAYLPAVSDRDRVMLLEAAGHAMLYANGEPRVGDPYQTGYVRLPILLHQGTNDLLFQCGRGQQLRARLAAPTSSAMLDERDATLPDLIAGEVLDAYGAVVAINATTSPLSGLRIRAAVEDARAVLTPVPTLPPLSVRKLGFRLVAPPHRTGGPETAGVKLALVPTQGDETLGTATLSLRVRRPGQTYKRTFRSRIDDSVQYYAVNPAQPLPGESQPPALFLTLHGAGVEAIGQADAYEAKSWGHLVAPTNRRPFGFDWEDWGRLDAMEVLALAQKQLHIDPRRVYLTGHSMGGHGAWHVGLTFPDRFAAIGPSAGWISFQSYAGAPRPQNPGPVEAMLLRAASPSDTLALARNTGEYGVYILHGGADDNVPVSEARSMNQRLAVFHHDLVFHEQPGAGHWWDASDEPGTDCVDWAPMFDFFAHRIRPDDQSIRELEFTTASPGVSAACHWVEIEAQDHTLQPSTIRLRCDPGRRRFAGTTENVARLALDAGRLPPGEPVSVELDGQKILGIPWPGAPHRIQLAREGDRWALAGPPSPARKRPQRYGPFKEVFQNRPLLVYGTRGAAEENAWAYAKARYDAETFWYRGNGSFDLVPDTDFDPAADRDRNVILYGNRATNVAWGPLLGDSPAQVERGRVRIGERELAGEALACLFIRPRPGSDRALVGVVSGSGIAGMRLTDRLPYFVSGVAYPDCTVIGPEMLAGSSAGLRAAGFFGNDWGVKSGEFAWRE